jgi:serine protease
VYVRLWSLMNGAWVYNDYTYTGANTAVKSVMVSPANGAALTGASQAFTWTAGSGVTQYWLYAGTTGAGSYNLYNQSTGMALTATVGGLPVTGGTVYVRLWSLMNGAWVYNDYTYTGANLGVKAAMTSPVNGTTLAGAGQTFAWTAGTNVTQYWLYVGTTGAGSYNLYNQSAGTNLSAAVAGLPKNGSTVYVRLWSLLGGAWVVNDYTYTAAPN